MMLLYSSEALVAAGAFSAAWALAIVLYRLFLHPLSKVPGPKLAALTQWVETYYECFKPPGGQFMWEYQKWHAIYGPIVRIGPNEVHIQDVTYYDTLYAQSRHSDKLKRLEHRFNNELSAFATAEHSVHRLRRGALNPFFSKRCIAQHAPNIQAHMDLLCSRVASEFLACADAVLNMRNMWAAFTTDIAVGYCLEEPYNFIMKPDFRADFSDAVIDLLDPVHFVTQFPWLFKAFKALPDRLVHRLYPPMRTVAAFNDEMKRQVVRANKIHASGAAPSSLFTSLLASDLPASELSTKRLQHEAISVIIAGIETTSNTLSVCTYHLLANPMQLSKLRVELVAAIPDARHMPGLDLLQQLPYLDCVINEALRLSYGTPQRIPRLSPTDMEYSAGGTCHRLPAGCTVSMDHYSASHDAFVFPDSHAFRPERWENAPVAPDGKPLTRYMIAFGRGTRSCVGMQLAYAELYIGVATFFRRFRCDLFETGRDAVDCYLDSFSPRPKPGTLGVRVKVTGEAS